MDVAEEPAIAALLARAETDPNIRGLVLSGSGARAMRTEHSDVDVYVVLEDTAGQRTTKTPEIDTIVVSLAELREVAPPPDDGGGWWFRYSFADARVLLDRTGGELPALLHAQATLTDDEVDATLDGYLDGYLNFYYRSLKSDREGRPLERRLDAVESVSWLLWTVFALHGGCAPTTSTCGTSSRSGRCPRRGRGCSTTSPSSWTTATWRLSAGCSTSSRPAPGSGARETSWTGGVPSWG